MNTASTAKAGVPAAESTAFRVLGAISFSHFLNDTIQSLMLAIYPLFKTAFHLNFTQIGLITLTYQCTASLLQPLVGYYTDRHPKPFSLAVGMCFTLVGLLTLSLASEFAMVLVAAALVGTGSSIFHPESSRAARMASGGRHGLAQSLFQVGGNAGTALGPLLAAFVVLPWGRPAVAAFAALALLGMIILSRVGLWVRDHRRAAAARPAAPAPEALPRALVVRSIAVLCLLIFSKQFYLAAISSYYTFYLIETFHVSVKDAQVLLFVFLGSVAVGTFAGGPIGDRIGRKAVIWISILGVLPFTLALPHVGLATTAVLSVLIGLILASAFSAIIVYAQDLMPGRVGMVAGLMFGFAFGIGGLGAAVLGELADWTSIGFVYRLCAWLPALGILTVLLPDLRRHRA